MVRSALADASDEALASGEAASEGEGNYQVGASEISKAEVDSWRNLRATPEVERKPKIIGCCFPHIGKY